MSETLLQKEPSKHSYHCFANRTYGIDLDGVCLKFIPEFSAFLKKYWRIDYSDNLITDYYWHRVVDELTEAMFWEAFHQWGKVERGYESLRPVDGAVDAISKLLKFAKDVWFITGRPHYAYEQTAISMSKWFNIPSDRIIFSNGKDYKSNVVNRLGIDVFIDDAPHYALSLANKTDARVYLMSAPYNLKVSDSKITRVSSWEDFITEECVA